MTMAAGSGPARGSQDGVQLAMALYPGETAQLRLTAQTGLKFAIARFSQVLGQVPRSQYVEALAKI